MRKNSPTNPPSCESLSSDPAGASASASNSDVNGTRSDPTIEINSCCGSKDPSNLSANVISNGCEKMNNSGANEITSNSGAIVITKDCSASGGTTGISAGATSKFCARCLNHRLNAPLNGHNNCLYQDCICYKCLRTSHRQNILAFLTEQGKELLQKRLKLDGSRNAQEKDVHPPKVERDSSQDSRENDVQPQKSQIVNSHNNAQGKELQLRKIEIDASHNDDQKKFPPCETKICSVVSRKAQRKPIQPRETKVINLSEARENERETNSFKSSDIGNQFPEKDACDIARKKEMAEMKKEKSAASPKRIPASRRAQEKGIGTRKKFVFNLSPSKLKKKKIGASQKPIFTTRKVQEKEIDEPQKRIAFNFTSSKVKKKEIDAFQDQIVTTRKVQEKEIDEPRDSISALTKVQRKETLLLSSFLFNASQKKIAALHEAQEIDDSQKIMAACSKAREIDASLNGITASRKPRKREMDASHNADQKEFPPCETEIDVVVSCKTQRDRIQARETTIINFFEPPDDKKEINSSFKSSDMGHRPPKMDACHKARKKELAEKKKEKRAASLKRIPTSRQVQEKGIGAIPKKIVFNLSPSKVKEKEISTSLKQIVTTPQVQEKEIDAPQKRIAFNITSIKVKKKEISAFQDQIVTTRKVQGKEIDEPRDSITALSKAQGKEALLLSSFLFNASQKKITAHRGAQEIDDSQKIMTACSKAREIDTSLKRITASRKPRERETDASQKGTAASRKAQGKDIAVSQKIIDASREALEKEICISHEAQEKELHSEEHPKTIEKSVLEKEVGTPHKGQENDHQSGEHSEPIRKTPCTKMRGKVGSKIDSIDNKIDSKKFKFKKEVQEREIDASHKPNEKEIDASCKDQEKELHSEGHSEPIKERPSTNSSHMISSKIVSNSSHTIACEKALVKENDVSNNKGDEIEFYSEQHPKPIGELHSQISNKKVNSENDLNDSEVDTGTPELPAISNKKTIQFTSLTHAVATCTQGEKNPPFQSSTVVSDGGACKSADVEDKTQLKEKEIEIIGDFEIRCDVSAIKQELADDIDDDVDSDYERDFPTDPFPVNPIPDIIKQEPIEEPVLSKNKNGEERLTLPDNMTIKREPIEEPTGTNFCEDQRVHSKNKNGEKDLTLPDDMTDLQKMKNTLAKQIRELDCSKSKKSDGEFSLIDAANIKLESGLTTAEDRVSPKPIEIEDHEDRNTKSDNDLYGAAMCHLMRDSKCILLTHRKSEIKQFKKSNIVSVSRNYQKVIENTWKGTSNVIFLFLVKREEKFYGFARLLSTSKAHVATLSNYAVEWVSKKKIDFSQVVRNLKFNVALWFNTDCCEAVELLHHNSKWKLLLLEYPPDGKIDLDPIVRRAKNVFNRHNAPKDRPSELREHPKKRSPVDESRQMTNMLVTVDRCASSGRFAKNVSELLERPPNDEVAGNEKIKLKDRRKSGPKSGEKKSRWDTAAKISNTKKPAVPEHMTITVDNKKSSGRSVGNSRRSSASYDSRSAEKSKKHRKRRNRDTIIQWETDSEFSENCENDRSESYPKKRRRRRSQSSEKKWRKTPNEVEIARESVTSFRQVYFDDSESVENVESHPSVDVNTLSNESEPLNLEWLREAEKMAKNICWDTEVDEYSKITRINYVKEYLHPLEWEGTVEWLFRVEEEARDRFWLEEISVDSRNRRIHCEDMKARELWKAAHPEYNENEQLRAHNETQKSREDLQRKSAKKNKTLARTKICEKSPAKKSQEIAYRSSEENEDSYNRILNKYLEKSQLQDDNYSQANINRDTSINYEEAILNNVLAKYLVTDPDCERRQHFDNNYYSNVFEDYYANEESDLTVGASQHYESTDNKYLRVLEKYYPNENVNSSEFSDTMTFSNDVEHPVVFMENMVEYSNLQEEHIMETTNPILAAERTLMDQPLLLEPVYTEKSVSNTSTKNLTREELIKITELVAKEVFELTFDERYWREMREQLREIMRETDKVDQNADKTEPINYGKDQSDKNEERKDKQLRKSEKVDESFGKRKERGSAIEQYNETAESNEGQLGRLEKVDESADKRKEISSAKEQLNRIVGRNIEQARKSDKVNESSGKRKKINGAKEQFNKIVENSEEQLRKSDKVNKYVTNNVENIEENEGLLLQRLQQKIHKTDAKRLPTNILKNKSNDTESGSAKFKGVPISYLGNENAQFYGGTAIPSANVHYPYPPVAQVKIVQPILVIPPQPLSFSPYNIINNANTVVSPLNHSLVSNNFVFNANPYPVYKTAAVNEAQTLVNVNDYAFSYGAQNTNHVAQSHCNLVQIIPTEELPTFYQPATHSNSNLINIEVQDCLSDSSDDSVVFIDDCNKQSTTNDDSKHKSESRKLISITFSEERNVESNNNEKCSNSFPISDQSFDLCGNEIENTTSLEIGAVKSNLQNKNVKENVSNSKNKTKHGVKKINTSLTKLLQNETLKGKNAECLKIVRRKLAVGKKLKTTELGKIKKSISEIIPTISESNFNAKEKSDFEIDSDIDGNTSKSTQDETGNMRKQIVVEEIFNLNINKECVEIDNNEYCAENLSENSESILHASNVNLKESSESILHASNVNLKESSESILHSSNVNLKESSESILHASNVNLKESSESILHASNVNLKESSESSFDHPAQMVNIFDDQKHLGNPHPTNFSAISESISSTLDGVYQKESQSSFPSKHAVSLTKLGEIGELRSPILSEINSLVTRSSPMPAVQKDSSPILSEVSSVVTNTNVQSNSIDQYCEIRSILDAENRKEMDLPLEYCNSDFTDNFPKNSNNENDIIRTILDSGSREELTTSLKSRVTNLTKDFPQNSKLADLIVPTNANFTDNMADNSRCKDADIATFSRAVTVLEIQSNAYEAESTAPTIPELVDQRPLDVDDRQKTSFLPESSDAVTTAYIRSNFKNAVSRYSTSLDPDFSGKTYFQSNDAPSMDVETQLKKADADNSLFDVDYRQKTSFQLEFSDVVSIADAESNFKNADSEISTIALDVDYRQITSAEVKSSEAFAATAIESGFKNADSASPKILDVDYRQKSSYQPESSDAVTSADSQSGYKSTDTGISTILDVDYRQISFIQPESSEDATSANIQSDWELSTVLDAQSHFSEMQGQQNSKILSKTCDVVAAANYQFNSPNSEISTVSDAGNHKKPSTVNYVCDRDMAAVTDNHSITSESAESEVEPTLLNSECNEEYSNASYLNFKDSDSKFSVILGACDEQKSCTQQKSYAIPTPDPRSCFEMTADSDAQTKRNDEINWENFRIRDAKVLSILDSTKPSSDQTENSENAIYLPISTTDSQTERVESKIVLISSCDEDLQGPESEIQVSGRISIKRKARAVSETRESDSENQELELCSNSMDDQLFSIRRKKVRQSTRDL